MGVAQMVAAMSSLLVLGAAALFQALVHAHGGDLIITSELGASTIVKVILPTYRILS